MVRSQCPDILAVRSKYLPDIVGKCHEFHYLADNLTQLCAINSRGNIVAR